ncbi:MAG: hypothetical protein KF802_00150 [Bdellovibrionaceae bacterium]|nr:hypothetical protein [Pseudobdellovibrionaceae bacterium]MBX3034781.1 hypothetical protein [Pseudobdellovibrionaceae bacterium]
MSFSKYLVAAFLTVGGSLAQAASGKGGFGFNVGMGLPYTQQAGLNYQFSERFGVAVGYNLFDFSIDKSGLKLSMPELMFNYHPFAGSFFIGLGAGQEKLEVVSTDTVANKSLKIEVSAMTTILKTGWMWGLANGGFWFGMDVAYVKPGSSDPTVTSTGFTPTDQQYLDAIDAAKKFGETAYTNITFARLGWIF